jgi:hypothetical protein
MASSSPTAGGLRSGRHHRLVLIAGGGLAALVGLTFGARIGGPVARTVFGPPTGFGGDAETLQALGQALSVLLVSLVACFTLLGMLLGTHQHQVTRGDAIWACNPVSMFTVFGLHFWIGNQIQGWQLPYEYVLTPAWMLHTFVGPFAYGAAILAGCRWTTRRTDRSDAASGRTRG